MLPILLRIFDPALLIRDGGLLLVFLFVFGQTGLFFCFFLPSGALLFTTGVFTATGVIRYNIITVCAILTAAAWLGNITGYWFGRKTGPVLFKRPDSKFFRQEHLVSARNFYSKYGGLAAAAAPFFPIIRTFAPIVAGAVKMNFRRFLLFSLLGSVGWVLSFLLAGFFLGRVPALKHYISYIIILIIIVVTVPIVTAILRKLTRSQNSKPKS